MCACAALTHSRHARHTVMFRSDRQKTASLGLASLGGELHGLHLGNLDVHADEPRRLPSLNESNVVEAGGGHDLADVHTRYSKAGPWGTAGLDTTMWRWVEDNKDAQSTAAFTSCGLLGGKHPRRALLLAAVLAAAWATYHTATDGNGNLHYVGLFWFSAVSFTVLGLMWDRKPRQANLLFLYGYYPWLAIIFWVASCLCSCTPEARCWNNGAGIKRGRPHRFPQCATEADWNSTEIEVNDDLPRQCIFNWVGGFLALALLMANAKWPHQQVFSFCGIVGVISFAKTCIVDGPNLVAGTGHESTGMNVVGCLIIAALAWGTLSVNLYRRRAATREAHVCVAGDVARYDVQWLTLLFADETRKQLTELAAKWRHYGWNKSALVRQPYSKLAELYRHAFVVNIWFQDTLIPDWREQMGLPTDQRFCNIKGPERAWVKCRRSYLGDVSRLSDVCRGEMVLQSVGELAKLLDIISADPRVEVMRGKCRFLLGDLDALRLADMKAAEEEADRPLVSQGTKPQPRPPVRKAAVGYRDIQLSLRCKGFVAPAAAGADPHFVATCQQHRAEFQLHLAEFKAIKDSSGHEGYERYRILLGL